MIESYRDILRLFFFEESGIYLIAGAILLLFLLVQVFKKKKSVKKLAIEGVLLAFIVVRILISLVPIMIDIKDNNVIEANYSYGQLYVQSSHKDFSIASPYLFKCDDYNIELSSAYSLEKEELKNGKIVYSEHSRVLLGCTEGKDVIL